jgi:hypothetical protein
MSSAREYTIDFIGTRVRSAAWGDLHLNVYTDTPTVEDLDRLAAAQRALRARLGGAKVGVFSFAEEGFSLPDAEVRRHGSQLQAKMSADIHASGVVVDGAGFWASAAMSVINTIGLVARAQSPSRVFKDVHEAARWMSQHMEVDAPGLVEATQRLRDEPPAT